MASKARTAVFTIVSKNYLHFARTLMQSVKSVHECWDRYVLLVDEVRGDFEPTEEDFTVVEVRRLSLPNIDQFLFRYTILELNTAVKPWMLEWLFEKQYERVVYIDPDIFVYRPMLEVEEALGNGKLMVLTPHLTGRLDEKAPDELAILRAGTYNLGFIALSRHNSLFEFLHWWQDKLEFQCVVDIDNGLFVDQKWIDLVPGIFPDVEILRHEGYNVAYWNLFHRAVSWSEDTPTVNGVPLVFFHFSGFDPANPIEFSKHQNRFTLEELPEIKKLALNYAECVMANGYNTFKQVQYAFGRFTDGQKINDFVRCYYRNSPDIRAEMGDNPFLAQGLIYNNADDDFISPYMRALWASRADLRATFPDIDNPFYRHHFIRWVIDNATAENGVPAEYVESLRNKLKNSGQTVGPAGRLFVKVAETLGPPIVTKFPVAWREKAKALIYRSSSVTTEEALPADSGEPVAPGLNIIGYVRSEHGVGESSRRCASAALAADIAMSMYDFTVGNPSRLLDTSFERYITANNPHRVNLFHINADQIPTMASALGRKFLIGHYNIGFWHWELPDFPDEWLGAFELLDEVWAPTSFVVQSISEKSPVPVLRMPHAIDFSITGSVTRVPLGLPEKDFLFLTMYDLSSFQARKNPQAVIKAFHRAFPDQSGVKLVVKTQNSQFSPDELRELHEFTSENPGIIHIDRTMTRQEVYELEALCDCFVSLHRSEGFGLGLAESMFLGKPVIGTNWSANTDFMNHANSCPVNYRLVELERSYGPYAKGQFWADPDVEHAAWYMKKLVEDQPWRNEIGKAGELTIKTQYSPKVIGEMYKKRLRYIEHS